MIVVVFVDDDDDTDVEMIKTPFTSYDFRHKRVIQIMAVVLYHVQTKMDFFRNVKNANREKQNAGNSNTYYSNVTICGYHTQ